MELSSFHWNHVEIWRQAPGRFLIFSPFTERVPWLLLPAAVLTHYAWKSVVMIIVIFANHLTYSQRFFSNSSSSRSYSGMWWALQGILWCVWYNNNQSPLSFTGKTYWEKQNFSLCCQCSACTQCIAYDPMWSMRHVAPFVYSKKAVFYCTTGAGDHIGWLHIYMWGNSQWFGTLR